MAGSWGGARDRSGRFTKPELDAIARGESDEAVAAITGRTVKAVRAVRARLAAPRPGRRVATTTAAVAAEARPPRKTVPAEPRKPASLDLAAAMRVVEESKQFARARHRAPEMNPFQLPLFPPKATPPKKLQMAMDDGLTWASTQWAGGLIGGVISEGLLFMGYPLLAELAQRPEYRVISETIADDATRRWVDFEVTGEEDKKKQQTDAAADRDLQRLPDPDMPGADPDEARRRADPDERKKKIGAAGKTDKVKALKDEMLRLEVRDRYYTMAVQDGFFGRSHQLLDFGADLETGSAELATDIGNGRDAISKGKVKKGSLRRIQPVEAVWAYPTTYNAVNPLREDWYNPQVWYVMGRQIHRSRLPTFIGHPVPDLLKPAYSFGGLSLSQMAKPYIDIWIQTRESVGVMVHSFSVMVLMTDMETILQPGSNAGGLMARVAMFNALRDNAGTFVVNNATEDFKNVSASLAGLHELQAQAQEHMCVQAGTRIETARGQVPIEEMTTDDLVLTRAGLSSIKWVGVTGLADTLIEIEAAGSVLRVTEEHPVWSASTGEFVSARTVSPSHRLLALNSPENTASSVPVWRVAATSVPRQPVYDIEVDGPPEFFANGILVHNSSVSRIPLVKLTGISPSGLNASSEGEIRAYYDTIAAYQNRFFRPQLTRLFNFMQLSLWGEIDPEISFEFEPLWALSEKEKGEKEKAEAERDQIYVDMGAFGPGEIRKVKIDDPELPYTGLDPDDVPDLREEEIAGLEPIGGRPQPIPEEEGEGGNQPDKDAGADPGQKPNAEPRRAKKPKASPAASE